MLPAWKFLYACSDIQRSKIGTYTPFLYLCFSGHKLHLINTKFRIFKYFILIVSSQFPCNWQLSGSTHLELHCTLPKKIIQTFPPGTAVKSRHYKLRNSFQFEYSYLRSQLLALFLFFELICPTCSIAPRRSRLWY